MLDTDYIYDYKTAQTEKSRCRIRIFLPHPPKITHALSIVIATELDDNPGMSITNSWEWLIPQLCHDFVLEREQTVFIEHYPASKAEFSKVQLIDNAHPLWQHITQDVLENLIGQPWIP